MKTIFFITQLFRPDHKFSAMNHSLGILSIILFFSTMPAMGSTSTLNSRSGIDWIIADTLSEDSDTSQIMLFDDDRVLLDTSIIETKTKIFIIKEYEDQVVIDRIDLKTGEKKRILDFDGQGWEEEIDSTKFRGHWSGIEYGLNDLVNSDFSIDRPDGYAFMDMRTLRSWNININFAQSSTALIGNHFGMVGGLGLELNSYFFQNDNSIDLNPNTEMIEEVVLNPQYDIIKSKLRTAYLTLPLILELQVGSQASKDRFYLSGGVIGGLRIASSLKYKYEVDNNKEKVIARGTDLNLNRWRLGLTARMGFQDFFSFYATYYLTPLFDEDSASEFYPLSVGFRIDF